MTGADDTPRGPRVASSRETTAVVVAAAALGLVGIVLANDAVARSARVVLGVFTPTGFLELGAAIVVVALAFALPGVSALLDPPLRRLGKALTPSTARIRERVGAVSALAIIVATAATAYASLAFGKTVPLVLGDELLYTNLAKSIATVGKPLVRGDLELGLSLGFPLFAAPAHLLASDGSDAYMVVQALNAIVFATAAVPAFLFARRLLGRRSSLAVAVATVIVPWLGYPAYVMTESLFYPTLIVFALVLARALDRPTAGRQAVLLVTFLAAVLVRPQGLALAVAIVAGVAAVSLFTGEKRTTLRVFAPTLVVLGVGVTVALGLGAAGVELPSGGFADVLDSYSAIWMAPLWALRTVGILSLALGVVPVVAAAATVRALARRDRSPRERNTAVVIAAIPLTLLLSVALLSSSAAGLSILHERNLFYVAPLLLTGLFAWAQEGYPRGWSTWIAAAVVLAAVATLWIDEELLSTNTVDSPTSALLRNLDGLYGISLRGWLVVIVVGALLVLATVRHRPVLLAWSLTFALAIAASVAPGVSDRSQLHALAWVDRALPGGETATLVHVDIPRPDLVCAESAEYEQQGLVLWTEFFNTSVDDLVHVYGTRGRDGIAATPVDVGDNGVLLEDGRELEPRYAVVDSRQQLVGTPVERFDLDGSGGREGSSLTLWRIDPPLRLGAVATPFPPRADGSDC